MCKVIQVLHISVSPFPSAEIEDIRSLATVLSLKLEVKEVQPISLLGYFSPFLRRLSCQNFGFLALFTGVPRLYAVFKPMALSLATAALALTFPISLDQIICGCRQRLLKFNVE